MDSDERRKWRRLQHELRVQLDVLGAGSHQTVTAIGTHLSPDGIFVQLADPPAADTAVRIRVGEDDENGMHLRVEGVVTNQFAPTDTTDVMGVGIFLADAGPSWRKLYELLSQGD